MEKKYYVSSRQPNDQGKRLIEETDGILHTLRLAQNWLTCEMFCVVACAVVAVGCIPSEDLTVKIFGFTSLIGLFASVLFASFNFFRMPSLKAEQRIQLEQLLEQHPDFLYEAWLYGSHEMTEEIKSLFGSELFEKHRAAGKPD